MLAASSRRKPSISLTPLIDVVFILLIFFMLVMQFKRYQQQPLALLTKTDGSTVADTPKQLQWLTLLGNGQCKSGSGEIARCPTLANSLVHDGSTLIVNYRGSLSLDEILTTYQQLANDDLPVLLGKANAQ